MIRNSHLVKAISLFCLTVILVSTFSYAWLTQISTSGSVNIAGGAQESYFNGGDGSCDTILTAGDFGNGAYQIHTARQMYFFSWLQYLGYFDNEQLYFVVTADIDMTGYTIPPIGTDEFPFWGNFNGNGHVISGVTISNAAENCSSIPPSVTSSEVPAKTQIIGFFGVVGSYGSNTFSGEVSYSSSVNKIYDLYLEDIVVETQTDNTLVGLVAGYVNAEISNVGVNVGSFLISDNASSITPIDAEDNTLLSKYSLIGFCTGNFIGNSNSTSTGEIGGGGDGDGKNWGGSFKFSEYYTKIVNISSSNSYIGSSSPMYYIKDGGAFPLSMESNGSPGELNTGYICGSSINADGDVKLATYKTYYYAYSIGATSTNAYSSTLTYSKNDLQIVTYSTILGQWVRIQDDYNTSNVSGNVGTIASSSYYPTYRRYDSSDLNLTRYMYVRDNYDTMASADTLNWYGLRFERNAIVSDFTSSSGTKSVTTVSNAYVQGKNYASYEVPKSCIDCSLSTSGYLTFLSVPYTSGSSFFSLHQVIRSNDGSTITAIKEIVAIYKNTGSDKAKNPYVYKYSDNTYSNTNTTTAQNLGSLLFDMDTIKGAASKGKVMYYFEIPVNKGEYALSGTSVNGTAKDGCYFLYLDISTSDGDVVPGGEVEGDTYYFPWGVDFIDDSYTVGVEVTKTDDAGNTSTVITPSCAIAILESSLQEAREITYSRVGNVITITVTKQDGTTITITDLEAGYIANGIVVRENGSVMEVPTSSD